MKSIRICVLEHSDASFQTVSAFYKNVFHLLGYPDVEVTNIYGQSVHVDDLYDVFVCDISFGKVDGQDGLALMKEVRSERPNLFIIANSQANVSLSDSSRFFPSFDLYVYKAKMRDAEYIEHITREVYKQFRTNVNITMDSLEWEGAGDIEEHDKKQLLSIVRQVTFTAHGENQSTEVGHVKLDRLTGGYSGSELYRMTCHTKNHSRCVNTVLKVSRDKDEYLKEKENYLKYVKWYLPFTWRPELVGAAESKDFGALCYSFLYNDDCEFASLSDYLKASNLTMLDTAIEAIFSPNRTRWYGSENFLSSGETTLTKHYSDRWLNSRDLGLSSDRFKRTVKPYCSLENNSFVFNGQNLPLPESFLLGSERSEYVSSLCHGDLNTNNIFLSYEGAVSFIDFSDTGRGHVFEDFVVVEGCVRTFYPGDSRFDELCRRERNLIAAVSAESENIQPLVGAEVQIKKLREYAFQTCSTEKRSNYFYALALYCFRLLRIADYEDDAVYERLCAVLVACIEYLSEHESLG